MHSTNESEPNGKMSTKQKLKIHQISFRDMHFAVKLHWQANADAQFSLTLPYCISRDKQQIEVRGRAEPINICIYIYTYIQRILKNNMYIYIYICTLCNVHLTCLKGLHYQRAHF